MLDFCPGEGTGTWADKRMRQEKRGGSGARVKGQVKQKKVIGKDKGQMRKRELAKGAG